MPMGAVIEMFSHQMPANRPHCAFPVRQAALKTLVALVVSLAAMLSLGAAQGLAVVTSVEGNAYGVTPSSIELRNGKEESSTFANEGGHPVVSEANVYAIYWDPDDKYHGDWQQVIDTFLHNAGAASGSLATVFAVDAQYTDKADQHAAYKDTFHGAYTDVDAYPTSGNCDDPSPLASKDEITCLTDAQIQGELKTFIAQHSLPTGMKSIFYVLTPPGVTVCLDAGGLTGHCSDFAWQARAAESTEISVDICRNEFEKNEIDNCSPKSPALPAREEMPITESYENSFCSYHSAISPSNPTEGDSETILYATIPWTAGGLGDGHLAAEDQTPAYYCQDGGFNPDSKPEIEERESPHPAEQEPNQIGRGPDGFFDHGLSDLIINQIAVEQQDIVTDPLLDAWHDAKGNEVMDECRNFFAPTAGGTATPAEIGPESTNAGSLLNQTINGGIYYLNMAFNLAATQLSYPGIHCIPGILLLPQFTAPNTVNVGELVGFNGMESDITLNAGTGFSSEGTPKTTYATYTWNFGDGSPTVTGQAPGAPSVNSPGFAPCSEMWEEPCAASAYHSYQYGGTYEVTLTVTDTGGNTARVSEPITVDGPPAPSPNPTPTPTPTPSNAPSSGSSSGAGNSSGSGSGGGAVQGQTSTAASVPAPIVTASVSSTSLKKVKSSGIAVRYTVNEQVAGSVQVLLESTIAKRLGIKGPVATGLAKGSPSSIVIGTAVLVTTKAGNGTIRIKFASKTAERLTRGHKLKLTLRLVARNASRVHPQTTTTLSTVVLSG
jgi:hypothetical protein